MNINAKRVRRTEDHTYLWKSGDVAKVTAIGDLDFCCAAMSQAWEERAVGFGEYDSMLNRNEDVNIYKCLPYPEGAVWDEYAIHFCPFCGAGLKVTVTDTIADPIEITIPK